MTDDEEVGEGVSFTARAHMTVGEVAKSPPSPPLSLTERLFDYPFLLPWIPAQADAPRPRAASGKLTKPANPKRKAQRQQRAARKQQRRRAKP